MDGLIKDIIDTTEQHLQRPVLYRNTPAKPGLGLLVGGGPIIDNEVY